MSDLVKRLRSRVRKNMNEHTWDNEPFRKDETCQQAADRIEELESEVRRLRARLEWVRTQEETPPFMSLIVADTLKGTALKEKDPDA